MEGLEGSLEWQHLQDGRLLSQPADTFCKGLSRAALSGQFQKCTRWPGAWGPCSSWEECHQQGQCGIPTPWPWGTTLKPPSASR